MILGSDKVDFKLAVPSNVATNNENESNIQPNRDEISKYMNARYVSASEGCWRIFDFSLHSQEPNTERLPIHLENHQSIVYSEELELATLIERNVETQLTQFLKLNSTNDEVKNLHYWEMPKFYRWHPDKKIWTRRVKYD